MPGLTIRRSKDEVIFLGTTLDKDNLKDTFDHKIRVQKVDLKQRTAELEVLTRQANYVDYAELNLEEGEETRLGETFISAKKLTKKRSEALTMKS